MPDINSHVIPLFSPSYRLSRLKCFVSFVFEEGTVTYLCEVITTH